jgi:hypothetical protein
MDRIKLHTVAEKSKYFIVCTGVVSYADIADFRASIPDHIPQEDIKVVFVDDNHGLSDIPNAPFDGFPLLAARDFAHTITKSEEFKLQELPENYFWRVHHCRKSFTKTGKRQAHSPIFFRQKRPFAKKHESR